MTEYWQALNPEAFHQGMLHGYKQGYKHGMQDGIRECDEADQQAQEAFTRQAAKSAAQGIELHDARMRLIAS